MRKSVTNLRVANQFQPYCTLVLSGTVWFHEPYPECLFDRQFLTGERNHIAHNVSLTLHGPMLEGINEATYSAIAVFLNQTRESVVGATQLFDIRYFSVSCIPFLEPIS
jgi:hypothetical protein